MNSDELELFLETADEQTQIAVVTAYKAGRSAGAWLTGACAVLAFFVAELVL